MFQIECFDHIAIQVADVDASIRWFEKVLGMEDRTPSEWGRIPVMMAAGDAMLALFPLSGKSPDVNQRRTRPHYAFRVDYSNFEAAQAHLKTMDVAFTFSDHVISHSIYFYDPDQHYFEITTYDLNGKTPST